MALFEIRQDHLDVSGQTTGFVDISSSATKKSLTCNRGERRLSLCDSATACRRSSCSVGDVSCEKQQAIISEEEVQVMAAVDAVVPAAVLGYEPGAVY